jgi:DHA1 family bicyclomycin/chloramphenicol resistance-like MFS transporter
MNVPLARVSGDQPGCATGSTVVPETPVDVISAGSGRAVDDPAVGGRADLFEAVTPPVRRAGSSGSSRRVPTGWRLVILVGSLSIFGPLCIDMYLPALPDISRQLHSSASAVQLTLTACLIGISVGQLLLGPVSDRMGRRPPLLIGLVAFIASSLACSIAPDIYVLAGCRFVQGVGGAAGIVISRSIVRDLHSGVALVRFFSTLMLATGLGPVLAPQIGSWILSFTSWRGVFLVLAGFGTILLFSAWWRVPETLPPDRRATGSVWSTLATMVSVGRDRVFLGYALACGLGMGGTFAYIAGSSFALQNVYGLSPQTYGLVFALNACGLVLGAQVNGRLAARFGPSALLTNGLITMVAGGAVLVTVVATGAVGLAGVIPALFLMMYGFGFVGPNAVALALQRYPQSAGAASAVLGSFQFILAALVAPLAGVGGTSDALPMALLILVLPIAALGVRILLAGSGQPAAGSGQPAAGSVQPAAGGAPSGVTGGAPDGSTGGRGGRPGT